MAQSKLEISISYRAGPVRGAFTMQEKGMTAIWDRIVQRALAIETDCDIGPNHLDLPWASLLSLLREFAPLQRAENFAFRPLGEAQERVAQFLREYKAVQAGRGTLTLTLTPQEIADRLATLGFSPAKRKLTDFQLRDLAHLLALGNGANFSVPGAGKTTVTFALHLLTRQPNQHLFVVAPKNAFLAWQEVVRDCMEADAPEHGTEPFTLLSTGVETIGSLLNSGATRFLISYDQLVRISSLAVSNLKCNTAG